MNEVIKDIITFACVFILLFAIFRMSREVREDPKQTQLLKQIAIQKGFAWYNPTNGNFEILTNK